MEHETIEEVRRFLRLTRSGSLRKLPKREVYKMNIDETCADMVKIKAAYVNEIIRVTAGGDFITIV